MIRCVIIEDDMSSAIDIKVKLEIHGYSVIDIIKDPEEINNLSRLNKADIILSDIKLGDGMYSYDFLLKHKNLPPIIFFTSHDDVKLYEDSSVVSSYVYLIKPVSGLSLHSSIRNALKDRTKFIEKDLKRVDGNLFIRSKGKLININPKEIQYIHSEGNYCYIVLESKKIVIRSSIKKVLDFINKPYLVQIHRSYIVNLPLIVSFDSGNNSIKIGKYDLPVSRSYKNTILSYIYAKN